MTVFIGSAPVDGRDFNKMGHRTLLRAESTIDTPDEASKRVLTFPTVRHYSALSSCDDVVASERFRCKPVKPGINA